MIEVSSNPNELGGITITVKFGDNEWHYQIQDAIFSVNTLGKALRELGAALDPQP